MRLLFTGISLLILFASCKQPAAKKQIDINSNGVRIAYTSCGEADTTLLFVHGWCINKGYWAPQTSHFCPRYKVVCIDLPGFGQSGMNRTDYNFDIYAADIKAVIEQLELKNVILIGHSMSGDIALNVSNKYPGLLAGIVGIDNLHSPGAPMTPEQEKDNDGFFEMLSTRFDSTVEKYMKPGIFKPETDTAIVNRVMNDVFATDSSAAISVLRSLVVIAQKEKPLMQGLSHKLYLVHSDILPVNADSLAKYCSKGFQAEPVRASSHYPMIENPAGFNTALQKVIDAIGKKSN
jgi:pimeloyl-ACP methyl ester carboxylesterase